MSILASAPLLGVHDLSTHFFTEDGDVRAVDGVQFAVARGEIFGLVGESGCGKSVTALSIMRLIGPPGKILGGRVLFDDLSLLDLHPSRLVEIRGRRISMIFQQPLSSLNPVFTIGYQVAEVVRLHDALHGKAAWSRAVDMLHTVGIPDPDKRARSYPHELSGGQAQRVMIAMALVMSPQLLIADEPTTALDVTIQAQILDLVRMLSSRAQTSVILITHDLGVIAEMASRVAVMYAGKIVEEADVHELFREPLHPYTRALIASTPVLGRVRDRLEVIPGSVPNLIAIPSGCRFAPRCPNLQRQRLEICERQEPALLTASEGHKVRCWLCQSPPNSPQN